MRHQKIGLFLFGLVLVILVLWAVRGRDPHHFEGKCGQCHVGLKNPSVLTRDPNHLCLDCHPDNEKLSHPSGIVVTKKLPEQYPVYNGKMVCVTCHFPHYKQQRGPENDIPAANESYGMAKRHPINDQEIGPFLLRAQSTGKMFCYSCHQGNFVSNDVDSHAISYQGAHTKSMGYASKEIIDDNSKECLSCHDGTLSSMADTQIKGLNWEHSTKIGLSHPIGVDYQAVYMSKSREFHPPERLGGTIPLINGKIGCSTCHNHYSKYPKHLVMDNRGSRLCLWCHNL